MVRSGDDGYRIPTPAEDDWERIRNGISPKPGDAHRLYSEVLAGVLAAAAVAHAARDARRSRRACHSTAGESSTATSTFQVQLAEDGDGVPGPRDGAARRAASRSASTSSGRSRSTTRSTARPSSSSAPRRCSPARSARRRTADETALIAEEKLRQRRHQDELRRLLREALPARQRLLPRQRPQPGRPAPTTSARARSAILGEVLPEVFDRFKEAAAKPADVKKGLDALFTAENLQGLPPVFGSLGLAARREGQDRLRARERPAARGAAPDRGARQLRRHGERPVPRRRVREGAVRLGLRGRPPARPVAAARRARSRRPARARRSTPPPASKRGHVLEQQPLPAGVVPARRRASSSRSW